MPSSEVMRKYSQGRLHSGSKGGPVVKDRRQAVAILMSERRAEAKNGGTYPEAKRKKKARKSSGRIHRAMTSTEA